MRENSENRWTIANIGLPVALGILFVMIFAFAPSRSDYSGAVETITINRWWDALCWATVATVVTACMVGLIGKRKRTRLWWLPFSFSIVSPFLCCGGLFNAIISYADMASAKDLDGTEYHLLGESFLQGHTLVIARLKSRVAFVDRYEVIVTSPWEGEYLEVVRPQDRVTDRPALWLTKDRILVGLPYENDAYVAYDLEKKRPYSLESFNLDDGYADIRTLSPFLLLKSGDVPSESDYKELLNPESNGYPDKYAVELDLYQSDPLRVSLAKKLLPVLRRNSPKLEYATPSSP